MKSEEYSLNPFVSQVGFFNEIEIEGLKLREVMSQSLRKSGRFLPGPLLG